MGSAATIYDVAKHAGVSPRTVSNVINSYPFVSKAMRERVQSSIEALDYRPNILARNLRRGRTGMVAIALPELGVPYFSELCQAIIDVVSERSYTVIVEQTDGDPRQERDLLANRQRASMFDGLIFSPLGLGDRELAAAPRLTPVVLLGERVSGGPFDHVSIDNVAAATTAVAHLVAAGRRRIAAIGHQPALTGMTARLRTEGYRKALRAARIKVDETLIANTEFFHRDEGAQAMNQLLALKRPPDAIFCYNDLLAIGALRALAKRGVKVPDDIAVVGFDDIEEGRYSTPELTTISPDKREIAKLATQQLLGRLEGDDGPPVDLRARFELVLRESA